VVWASAAGAEALAMGLMGNQADRVLNAMTLAEIARHLRRKRRTFSRAA
jgi:hypothetical protein